MRLYSQKDVDKKALRGARIAILGYGSQGRAHALNLHDSGFDVVVGVRKGDSWKKPKKTACKVMEPAAPSRAPAGVDAGAGPHAKIPVRRNQGSAGERRHAAVRARLQHSLQADQAAQGSGRGADRAEGPGRPGAPPVPAGTRRALPDRGGAGCDRQGMPRPRRWPMRTASAAPAAACSRPPLPRRPRRICSASRPCCAAAPPNWWSRATRPWSKPATSPAVAYYECLHELKLIVDLLHEGGITKMHKLHQRNGQVRRSDPRPAHRQQGHEEGNAQDPRRDPAGQICPPMDCGEQGRPAQVFEAPESRSDALHRKGRRPAARPHALAGIRQSLIRGCAPCSTRCGRPMKSSRKRPIPRRFCMLTCTSSTRSPRRRPSAR
jgi:ketol-acid reductoisomerase